MFFPRFNDKSFLLGAWPEKETRKSAIRDPMGQPITVYRKVYTSIESHVERIVPVLDELFYP
jgi:hypothetical protein